MEAAFLPRNLRAAASRSIPPRDEERFFGGVYLQAKAEKLQSGLLLGNWPIKWLFMS